MMTNTSSNIIVDQNELELIKEGLDKLIEQWVRSCEEGIRDIFNAYPSIKETKFSDAGFQKTIQKELEDVLGNRGFDSDYMFDFCKKYPFVVEKVVEDKEIQNQIGDILKKSIESLQGVATTYRDAECTQYQDDRLSDLFRLERLYQNPIVSDTTKKKHETLLLDMVAVWVWYRTGGTWIGRVANLIKMAKVSNHRITMAVFEWRKHSKYSPKVANLKQFPEQLLSDIEVQRNVYWRFEEILSKWDIKLIKTYADQYEFVRDRIDGYEKQFSDITDINIDTNQENKSRWQGVPVDKDAQIFLLRVSQWLIQRIKRGHIDEIQGLMNQYPTTIGYIERNLLVEAVYESLSDPHHNKDKETITKKLLECIPLTEDEARTYVEKYCGIYDISEIEKILGLFPEMNLRDIFQKPEKKNAIIKRLPDIENPENKKYFMQLGNITSAETVDAYFENLLDTLNRATNLENNPRWYSMPKMLDIIRRADPEIVETLKERIATDEIKQLIHIFAQQRISDRWYSFTDVFGRDEDIKKMCEDELFPLSYEEMQEDVRAVILKNCRWWEYSFISCKENAYAIIKERMGSNNVELREDVIIGIVKKIKQASQYDAESKKVSISLLLRTTKIWYDVRNDSRVQEALLEKKNFFLSEWDIKNAQAVSNRPTTIHN